MPPMSIPSQYHFTTQDDVRHAVDDAIAYYNRYTDEYRYGQALFNCLASSNWSHVAQHFAGTSWDPFYWRMDTIEEQQRMAQFFVLMALFVQGSPGPL